jgi:hypothetical protein
VDDQDGMELLSLENFRLADYSQYVDLTPITINTRPSRELGIPPAGVQYTIVEESSSEELPQRDLEYDVAAADYGDYEDEDDDDEDDDDDDDDDDDKKKKVKKKKKLSKFEKIENFFEKIDHKILNKFLHIKEKKPPEPPEWAKEKFGESSYTIDLPPWEKYV